MRYNDELDPRDLIGTHLIGSQFDRAKSESLFLYFTDHRPVALEPYGD